MVEMCYVVVLTTLWFPFSPVPAVTPGAAMRDRVNHFLSQLCKQGEVKTFQMVVIGWWNMKDTLLYAITSV